MIIVPIGSIKNNKIIIPIITKTSPTRLVRGVNNLPVNMATSFEVQWATSKMWAYVSANKKGKLFIASMLSW